MEGEWMRESETNSRYEAAAAAVAWMKKKT